jgi:hypothetical protein
MGAQQKKSIIHKVLFDPAPEGITEAILVEFRHRNGNRTGELHLTMPDRTWMGEWSLPMGGEDFRLTALWEDLDQAKRLYEIGVRVIADYLLGRSRPN